MLPLSLLFVAVVTSQASGVESIDYCTPSDLQAYTNLYARIENSISEFCSKAPAHELLACKCQLVYPAIFPNLPTLVPCADGEKQPYDELELIFDGYFRACRKEFPKYDLYNLSGNSKCLSHTIDEYNTLMQTYLHMNLCEAHDTECQCRRELPQVFPQYQALPNCTHKLAGAVMYTEINSKINDKVHQCHQLFPAYDPTAYFVESECTHTQIQHIHDYDKQTQDDIQHHCPAYLNKPHSDDPKLCKCRKVLPSMRTRAKSLPQCTLHDQPQYAADLPNVVDVQECEMLEDYYKDFPLESVSETQTGAADGLSFCESSFVAIFTTALVNYYAII